jgi:flagellar biosynthesis protein FliQ
MNTKISAKLAALAIALMMNGLIIGAVACLFDAQTQPHLTVLSFAKQLAQFQWVI